MAEDSSVFIRGGCTREQVVDYMCKLVGHPLERVEEAAWTVYSTLAVGLDVRVYDQDGFVDDLGIPFSRYEYVVDLQDLPGAVEEHYRREWRRLFACVVASGIAGHLHCECIAVDKMQHMLGTFAPGSPR